MIVIVRSILNVSLQTSFYLYRSIDDSYVLREVQIEVWAKTAHCK